MGGGEIQRYTEVLEQGVSNPGSRNIDLPVVLLEIWPPTILDKDFLRFEGMKAVRPIGSVFGETVIRAHDIAKSEGRDDVREVIAAQVEGFGVLPDTE